MLEPRLRILEAPPLHELREESVPAPERRRPHVDSCFKTLVGIQEQVKLADGKTGFLFGINALMFGFVTGAIGPLKAYLAVNSSHPLVLVASASLALFVLLDAASVCTLVSTVMSRFGGIGKTSHMFFGHIVHTFDKDYQRYADEVLGMDEEAWAREICGQIVEVSHIAYRKHKLVRRAGYLTIAAFFFWLVAVMAAAMLP